MATIRGPFRQSDPERRAARDRRSCCLAEAADHDFGLFAGQLHLQLRFLSDDGLVQHHVIEHAASA
jgi:hypothetical protein